MTTSADVREFMSALSLHRYPRTSLVTDGLRSAFGLAVCFGPLIFFDVAWPLAIVLGGMGIIFLIFTFRLVEQHWSSIELTKNGICLNGPRSHRLEWSELTALRLSHYGAARRSSPGWYQLSIHAQSGGLQIDSTIDRFGDIVTMATKAARDRALVLDPATTENLKMFDGDIRGRHP